PKRCSDEGRKRRWRSQLVPGCNHAPAQPSETTTKASGFAPPRALVRAVVAWPPAFEMRTASSSDDSPGEVVANSTDPRSATSVGDFTCAPHATQSAKKPNTGRDMRPPRGTWGGGATAARERDYAAIALSLGGATFRAAIHRSSHLDRIGARCQPTRIS